jgi:DNA polymerase III subunit gamma/tau
VSTALYRRYRPETFAEVIGQEHVTAPLSAAIDAGRINHAFLFSGPRGCGKTTSARILARCLNCAEGPTSTPCGQCESCRDLSNGGPGSLDVVEIDAASHNGVDDARDLRERAVYAPARDRYKVFILDEAHMVTPQGFNALLKLVEEPPAHVKFVFATTEPDKVIGTIRSRTHHYPFRLVPPETLGGYLEQLASREGVRVGTGVLPLVVRAGGGSVRDTLSVLDQLIAGATADGVDYTTAVALLGYTDDSLLGDVVDAFSAGDGAGVFRVIDRVIESGHDPRRFVEDLLERFRDLFVISAAQESAAAFLPEVPQDRLERLKGQARAASPAGAHLRAHPAARIGGLAPLRGLPCRPPGTSGGDVRGRSHAGRRGAAGGGRGSRRSTAGSAAGGPSYGRARNGGRSGSSRHGSGCVCAGSGSAARPASGRGPLRGCRGRDGLGPIRAGRGTPRTWLAATARTGVAGAARTGAAGAAGARPEQPQ